MDAICLTQREKRCIVLNNFKFREYKKLKNRNFNFWCTNKLCNANVIVSNNSDQIVDQCKSSEHNHEVYSDRIISRKIVRSSLKKKAENDLHTRPNKLIGTPRVKK
jgi:hypothetical protein